MALFGKLGKAGRELLQFYVFKMLSLHSIQTTHTNLLQWLIKEKKKKQSLEYTYADQHYIKP